MTGHCSLSLYLLLMAAGSVAADDQAPHLGTYLIDFNGTGGSAIEADGWTLTVPADSVGISIARYRFSAVPHRWQDAPDCLVTGVKARCAKHRWRREKRSR